MPADLTKTVVDEDVAREAVVQAVAALIDAASTLSEQPLDQSDLRAANGKRKKFATTRGYVLWFVCDHLVSRGVVDGDTIRGGVPYVEIAFAARERVQGRAPNEQTVRWAFNDWAGKLPRPLRFPVQIGVEAEISFSRAVSNDNLAGLECSFRSTRKDASVVIAPATAPETDAELVDQWATVSKEFFQSRSRAVQLKMIRVFSKRRYVAPVVAAITGISWIAYTIIHSETRAYVPDPARQGQLERRHEPLGPPKWFTVQKGEAAGVVEIREEPGAEVLIYRPTRPATRIRPDISNIQYEWHVRDSNGNEDVRTTDEPRLRFSTVTGLSLAAVGVHAVEYASGKVIFGYDGDHVQLLSAEGKPLTQMADAVYTADGVGGALDSPDRAAMTFPVSITDLPVLDKAAIARELGVKKFEYAGRTDAPVILDERVVWQECLMENASPWRWLKCEKSMLLTHLDNTIATKHRGLRGTFTFRAPEKVAGRKVVVARWGIRNLETGLIAAAGEGMELRHDFAPGRYSVACTVVGEPITKHHTTGAESEPHGHSVLNPYSGRHTVISVF